jgi:WD40 repeat protein
MRAALALIGVLLTSSVYAAEPRPLWEIDLATPAQGGVAGATLVLAHPASTAGSLSYSPDGQAIVAVTVSPVEGQSRSYQYRLRVWDVNTRKERFTADIGFGRTPYLRDNFASFPADDMVMTGGEALTVRSLATGVQSTVFPTGGRADHAIWAVPDLRESFYLRREVDSPDQPLELHHHSTHNTGQQVDFGGMGMPRRGRIGVGQQFSQQAKIPLPVPGVHTELVTLNPARTRLVATFRDESGASKPRHTFAVYGIHTIENFEVVLEAEAVAPHPGPVSTLEFARNGKILATGGEDGSICLWDMNTSSSSLKPRAVVEGVFDHRVYALAFSHDWRYVAAASWDRTRPNLAVIDVDSGKVIRTVKIDREPMCLAFHPDGETLLTTSASGKISAWSLRALLETK